MFSIKEYNNKCYEKKVERLNEFFMALEELCVFVQNVEK